MKTYTVELVEDGEEVALPLPQELLDELKWNEGDTLIWSVKDNNSFILAKKND
jgi:antitoxin component of MazEF toxin-antitoxin module